MIVGRDAAGKKWGGIMTQNNRGFSLAELVVIISIISIMISVAGVGISMASSRDVDRFVKVIDLELERVRMAALSQRGQYSLEIDRGTNQLFWNRIDDSEPGRWESEPLSQQVEITFREFNGTPIDAAVLFIQFDKSSGAVGTITDGAGNEIETALIEIIVTDPRNGKNATIVLVSHTGKHYVE